MINNRFAASTPKTTRSDGRTLVWDYDNRLVSTSDGGVYEYSSQYQRIKKADKSGVTRYYFFPEYEEEYTNGSKTNTIKYYFAANQRVAENSTKDGVRYYTKDHLGSSTVITDAKGSLIPKTTYAPYGSETSSQGSADVAYKFTDKEKDSTGLIYFGARYYDPVVGRFISVDPTKDGGNWYEYCDDNPLNYVDPDGKEARKIAVFNYSHKFTNTEANRAIIGKVIMCPINIIVSACEQLKGLVNATSVAQTAKSLNGQSDYDQMVGPLGIGLDATGLAGTTFMQSTTIEGNYNNENILTSITVTTSYSFENDSSNVQSNNSGTIILNFSNSSGYLVCTNGNASISYASPEQLCADVGSAYSDYYYDYENEYVYSDYD